MYLRRVSSVSSSIVLRNDWKGRLRSHAEAREREGRPSRRPFAFARPFLEHSCGRAEKIITVL
jgi:hypothetical protein